MCVSSLICYGTGQSESSNGLQRATVFSVQRFAITATQIAKYAPLTIAMHTDPTSDQPKYKNRPSPSHLHHQHSKCREIIRNNNIFIENIEITGRTFSDQTGRFVCPSISGNNHVFAVYDYDSNFIHALPIPTRKKEHILMRKFVRTRFFFF